MNVVRSDIQLVDLEEGGGGLLSDGCDGLQAAGGEGGGGREARPAGRRHNTVLAALDQKLHLGLLSSVGFNGVTRHMVKFAVLLSLEKV